MASSDFDKGKIISPQNNRKNKMPSIFVVLFLFLIIISSFSFKVKSAQALIPVTDIFQKVWEGFQWTSDKIGSSILQDSITATLNKLAYDAANQVATGNKGQGSLFIKENWNQYLKNMGDNAAGKFIEQLGQKNSFLKFDLCEPSLDVKMRIGLGMVEMNKPQAPDCTWSEMKNNWKNEYERLAAMSQPDFLKIFQNSFEPRGNDLGLALSLQTGMTESVNTTYDEEGLKLQAKGGWLDPTDIAGNLKSVPGWVEKTLGMTGDNLYSNIGRFTGNALVDASKIFLNQLAISTFNNKMMKLGQKSAPASSPYSGNYGGLADYNAGPGVSEANNSLRQLLEPRFDTRADYNILGELAMCPDATKAGPTNCVIDEGFRQAIEERKTVGEAINLGYLKDWPFGFKSIGSSAIEPNYNQGYPYRSMLILRKYRIIPVGWELAAEYISTHSEELGNATLAKMVACFDPNDNYRGYNDNGSKNWCQGLVDPNWVLKAPQGFCAKQGYGPEIMSNEITEDENGKKSRIVYRNDQYCADEQSCIKEKNDGSCEAYGYCTKERRSWKFEVDACDPKYNTCQTFRGENGKTFSYLENTLDYGNCGVDNVGCKDYTISSSGYDEARNVVNWTGTNSIYFDADAGKCSEESEGCHEYIRTKSGLGTNLIINSGFENNNVGDSASLASRGEARLNDYWPLHLEGTNLQTEIVDGAADRSGKILRVTIGSGRGGLYAYDSSSTIWSRESIMPKDFVFQTGFAYTLSAYVYMASGSSLEIGVGNNDTEFKTASLSEPGIWKRIILTVNNDNNLAANELYIYGNGAGEFYIDNLQLEIGSSATNYKDYGAANKVYEKLAPSYLDCGGANPPAKCGQFIKICQPADVGCEFYTSASDGISIPAKTTVNDFCPAECVGFDNYIQLETGFDSLTAQYFIPKTARTCSASAVGCDEFTNLDAVASGGESKEYYSYLRQCIKPDNALADCREYYTWEGSDESGYQLRVFNLQSSGNEPDVTSPDNCSEAIYNLPATDPGYNSDCRQFYNRAGGTSYHSYTKTISCSDNCHSYRRTAADETQENCENHGGEWNTSQQTCAYMAIPGEGKSCSAAQAGCREYSGNKGSNMRIVLNNDFEGDKQGWLGNMSNESLAVGGNSLEAIRTTNKTVGFSVVKGKSYVLSFMAKGAATEFNSIALINKDADRQEFSVSNKDLGNEWKLYRFNLASLGYDVDDEEKLEITANGNFYIDDIRLTEVVSRYYLIKNSWQTPDSCNQDINGNSFPLYMLGCDQYQNQDNKISYLHNFDQLCQESAVGCELMIDTHNFSETNGFTLNGVVTPADNLVYAVYDKNKECNKVDKGCGRFGSPYKYGDEIIYSDIYLKNDPDRYREILCEENASGCAAWASENSTSYFKDPGDTVCEWRQASGTGEAGWGWYKKKVKRCGGTGSVCLTNGNCSSGDCVLETGDSKCEDSNLKTFGYGGEGKFVYQPIEGWAGICPAAQASCTEFIDPVSKPSSVLSYKDGDKVALEPNTLYILKASGAVTGLGSCSNIYKLSEDTNELESKATSISVASGKSSVFFNGLSRSECTASGSGQIKKAMVEYRLKDELDSQVCNGLVDFEKGCVLFNERTQNAGSGLASLGWKALDADDGNGVSPTKVEGENNANKLIKVMPDRVCDEWLACRSYIKNSNNEPVCFDVGLCNSLDDIGNCDNFISSNQNNMNFTYGNTAQAMAYNNYSGYSKIKNGQYYIDKMDQVGEVVELSNGGFEMSGGNGYPVGWSGVGTGTWDDSKFKVMSNADEISNELGKNIYPPEGASILKIASRLTIESEEINLSAGDYEVSAYANTKNLAGSAIISAGGGSASLSSGRKEYIIFGFNLLNQSTIKISLTSDASGGVVYFDDIKIKPVLKIEDSKYVHQSCRLYPKEDSLSCSYFDSAGVGQKGLTGYCLQYDRYPGSTDACLMWYPIDKVKGEGVEESAGYKGKFPLYYCTKATTGTKLKVKGVADDAFNLYIDNTNVASGKKNGQYKEKVTSSGGVYNDGVYGPGKHVVVLYGYNGKSGGGYVSASIESVNSAYMTPMVTSIDEKYGWFCTVSAYNADFHSIDYSYNSSGLAWTRPTFMSSSNRIMGADNIWPSEDKLNKTWIACRTIINIAPVCQEFIQTVSSSGSNKVFQARISGGNNDFFTNVNAGLGYNQQAYYGTDAIPYGTIVYPKPASNPYEWDTRSDDGIQPIYYNQDKTSPRLGQLYNNSLSELKKIFAKSYGAYELTPELTCLGGGVCRQTGTETISYCDLNSENPNQECSTDTCLEGCVLTKDGTKYTCGGADDGAPCCAVIDACSDEGKCLAGENKNSSCDAQDGNTVEFCKFKEEYKCDLTTTFIPGSGQDCCFGGSCERVCSDSDNVEAVCNSDVDCKSYRCTNNGRICSNDIDCNVRTCVGGDKSGSSCYDNSSCAGDDGSCIGDLCVGGSRYGSSCDDNSDCLGSDGTCQSSTGFCNLSDYGTCTLSECQGGPNDGEWCNFGGNGKGCAGGDLCVPVYRKIDNKRCCYYLPSTNGSPGCVSYSENMYGCVDGSNPGVPCSAREEGQGSNSGNEGRYTPIPANRFANWIPPTVSCSGLRGADEYCGISPIISNIKANDNFTATVIKNGFVNLSFNTTVDQEQLPLVEYTVDWGDGEETVVAGAEMNHRPDPANPHEVFHLYSYGDLKNKYDRGISGITCGADANGNYCRITPKVKIKDNWGWCNDGTVCNGFVNFSGAISVRER